MLPQVGVPFGAVLEKSKKRRAIAPAVLGGCGGLDRLLESLPELWEGLEGPKKIKSAIFGYKKSPCGHMLGDT